MSDYKFPEGFIWSCATASAQIEGASNEDGKGPSIWDEFCKVPGNIRDGSNIEVTCDSYHLYQTDVDLLKNIRVQQYRFSISWSRVLPRGTVEFVNTKGVLYYHNLIDALIAANIQPAVTLFHWDLPQAIQDRGGWLNGETVQIFEDYARFCFREYGDKVKYWITLNEPWVHAIYGHAVGVHAPGFNNQSSWAPYLCAHHLLLSHAKAYRCYENEFKRYQKGECGITLVCAWKEKASNSAEDVEAAQKALEMELGWFAHPIFKGDYPAIMKNRMTKLSDKEGRKLSRLPQFTAQQIIMLRGSADFLGLNYYITRMVRERRMDEFTDGIQRRFWDAGTVEFFKSEWPRIGGEHSWIRSVPWGFRKLLNFIRTQYGNPRVLITENGCCNRPEDGLMDFERIKYVGDHLKALHQALTVDGCNVIGYTLWSLMDNFEWAEGFTRRFGIYEVDFSDPKRQRKPKLSASWYKKCVMTNSVADLVAESKV